MPNEVYQDYEPDYEPGREILPTAAHLYQAKRANRFIIESDEIGYLSDMIVGISPIRFVRKKGDPGFEADDLIITFMSVVSPSVEQKIYSLMQGGDSIQMAISELGPMGDHSDIVQKWTVLNAKPIDINFGGLDIDNPEFKKIDVRFKAESIELVF